MFTLVCICVVATVATCDRDVTVEALSLQQQVRALQTSLQTHIHQQDAKNDNLEKRIHELEEENHELKDQNNLLTRSLQKRVSGLGAGDNSIGFSASLSTTKVLGLNQIVVFDTIITNDGNGYDTREGHFTAPVPGLYAFSVTAMCFGSDSHLHVAIVKDNQKIAYIFANGNNFDNGSKLVVVRLQAGQMVWVEHFAEASGTKINGDAYSTFSGFLIQAYDY